MVFGEECFLACVALRRHISSALRPKRVKVGFQSEDVDPWF